MTRTARWARIVMDSLRKLRPERYPVPPPSLSLHAQMEASAEAAQRERDVTEQAWLQSGARPLRGPNSKLLVRS